jgi:hypothetical protein
MRCFVVEREVEADALMSAQEGKIGMGLARTVREL